MKNDIATSLEQCFSEYKSVRSFVVGHREKLKHMSSRYAEDTCIKNWKAAIEKYDSFSIKPRPSSASLSKKAPQGNEQSCYSHRNDSTVFTRRDAISLIQLLQNDVTAIWYVLLVSQRAQFNFLTASIVMTGTLLNLTDLPKP